MKTKTKKARCKNVIAILNNKVGTYPLLREEIWPYTGDMDYNDYHCAVLQVEGAGSNNEVMVCISCVLFLKD
jgi:hypothetical protein